MSENIRATIIWILVGGFIAYVSQATLDARFIVALDQEEDWCTKIHEYYGGTDNTLIQNCVEFKDSMSLLIYAWNHGEKKKKKWVILANYFLMLGLTVLVLNVIPKLRGRSPTFRIKREHAGLKIINHDEVFSLLLLTFIVSVVVPLGFMWVLPAPVDWFPSVITEMSERQIIETVEGLRSLLDELGNPTLPSKN